MSSLEFPVLRGEVLTLYQLRWYWFWAKSSPYPVTTPQNSFQLYTLHILHWSAYSPNDRLLNMSAISFNGVSSVILSYSYNRWSLSSFEFLVAKKRTFRNLIDTVCISIISYSTLKICLIFLHKFKICLRHKFKSYPFEIFYNLSLHFETLIFLRS